MCGNRLIHEFKRGARDQLGKVHTSRNVSKPFAMPSRASLFRLKLSNKPGATPAVRQRGSSAVLRITSLKKASMVLCR